ncbi:proton-coupled zinc antiporter SLC30A5 isoform X2 [Procambarus clarkii]|uniref:proton-coupled zinc antiporter SLC30A5 isoform X2 n=1 Tax=Procambarus clarkii TaxID=6728 RepID=UPI001E67564A|nr:zinc transporter 5-like isoform X2 [Procambarus clarkii]XP_045581077.1 zinc transporter 5-like isoform X2 [Procambarus clarkii]XP_045581082.1 zinc transporter 5-like isoform X2 [Procambarus clarkii]XP_045581088.1 zinc transporter 5-like isoform X2 [Procambarus clarkii]XP_045581095.1 zinc transporter 5-like isoform X2 [Procambarus clarkii]
MRSSPNLGFIDGSASRVIYPPTKISWYVWLLLISKFFRCIGVFVAYDAVQSIHVVYFLLLVTLLCSLVYGFIQRPLSGSKKLQQVVWINIARHAFVQTCLNLLWFCGLAHVGPLRAVLLSEHADVVVLAVWGAVLKGIGGPGRLRGSFWFVLGVLSLVLFDNDLIKAAEHPEGQQHHGISHLLYYLLAWTGLSDHEGGIVVLLLTLCLQAYVNNGGRRLAVDVGGSKRLHALTAIVSAGFLCPLALIIWMTQDSPSPGTLHFLPQAFAVALFVFVLHYYIDAACVQRLDVMRTARVGTLATFFAGLLLSAVWKNSVRNEKINDSDMFKDKPDHGFSGGVAFSIVMLSAATLQLTSSKERWRGPVGMSSLPLHGLPGEALHRSQSLLTFLTTTLKLILSNRNSRTIFYFLCVNLCFTFVEFAYGMWTNSLGLISDGFHMLFDCSALVMGLVASVMARWKPTKTFPFGYGRIEVLSGFVNGLFLTVIGFMVLCEALGRLWEPPQVHTERLLAVAVGGLIVNLFGIVSFSHNHSHGHTHGSSHGHAGSQERAGSHGHAGSHGCAGNHGHQAASHAHSHNINTNMQGVFLHILADTLGSVAVIISSLLIDWYGWLIADPICSLILSGLILASVLPLLKESASVLLLRVPTRIEESAKTCLEKILEIEHVISCRDPRFWQHSGDIYVSTIVVQCKGDISEQRIIHNVTTILEEAGFSQTTVEVEVLSGIDPVVESPPSQWGLGTIVKTRQNPFPNSIRAI